MMNRNRKEFLNSGILGDGAGVPEKGFIPSRPSLRTRIEHWIAGQQNRAA